MLRRLFQRTGVLCATLLMLGITVLTSNKAASFSESCTPPPPGMVAWYPGDGNTNDFVGSDNGTPVNGAAFAPGLVGQAFKFTADLDSGVLIPSSPALN